MRAFFGHLLVRVKSLDEFDQQAFGAFADDDGRSGVAARKERFARVQS